MNHPRLSKPLQAGTALAQAPEAPGVTHKKARVPREVWWFVLVGASLRVVFFIFGQNNGGDAVARAELTARWLQHPALRLNFEPWLPLHFWLMAGMSFLVRDTAVGTRLLSLVLGLSSLWVLWLLARRLYNDSTATFSLAIFALYSLHIAYSTTSSSEVPYLFFVLLGLLAFFIHRETHSLPQLCLSAVALGVAAGIRYEAWVCIFSLFLILVFMPSGPPNIRRRIREVLLFGCLAGLWPVFWMLYQWKFFSKPLYGVTMNYAWVPQQLTGLSRSMLYRFALPPGVLLITLTPVVLAAALYGMWLSLRQPRGREFCVVISLTAAAFVIQIAKGGLLPLARYTITLGTFAIIVAGYGFDRWALLLPRRRALQFRVAVGVLLACNLGGILVLSESRAPVADKFASISPLLRFPRHIEKVRQFLVPHLRAGDRVVVDDYNVESNIVAAAIGLPLLRGNRAFLASEQPLSELFQYISTEHPRYLIYSSQGTLRDELRLPNVCSSTPLVLRDGMGFSCVFSDDVYQVYTIRYAPSGGMIAER
ncbi:MAG TPA: glycosyltransferase family 39 protein [Candidatus Aquilonibacter sp.]|nr:glycosyltransferase family 39 protein [Candidatus Aquilonibacter sp.]